MAGLPRAVLIDLDDTILDDSGAAARCWPEACAALGAELKGLDPATLLESIERTRRWYWSDAERHRVGRLDLGAARTEVVATALTELDAADPSLAARIAATYSALRDREMRPFAGSIETVIWLREGGCRLALVTNGASAAQRRKIDRFDLTSLFDLVLIEGELGFGKPDPRVYRRALDGLEVAPADAWMIGDNLDWDVTPPQARGIRGIWIDIHGAGLPAGHAARPDRIVRSLAELRVRDDRAGDPPGMKAHQRHRGGSNLHVRVARPEELLRVREAYSAWGYNGGCESDDVVLLAERDREMLGVVRCTLEHGIVMLRGMQVAPHVRRQHVGTCLLESFVARLQGRECYCIPFAHLVAFYERGGFQLQLEHDAPPFLLDRLTRYRFDGLSVVLMRRPGE